MSETEINYEEYVQNALKHVMVNVLKRIVAEGLPGEHHFYITFRTHADGVLIPQFLHDQYPDEMTVVLQSQFWNLAVSDDGFDVDLKFNGTAASLTIPFSAVTTFVDPSVQFALQFNEDGDDDTVENSIFAEASSFLADDSNKDGDKAAASTPASDGDNVVTLDAFRKK